MWDAISDPPGVCVDLGHHRLADQATGIDLVQVAPDALTERQFPALRSLRDEQSNLTKLTDATVGHTHQLETLLDALMHGARCHAIIGTAGVGKSRLAKLASLASAHAYRGGAWLIELAGCTSQSDVLQAVASTLSIPITQASLDAQLATVGRAIANRGRTLLVLDNSDRCEAALSVILPQWLDEGRGLFTILTSRRVPADDRYTIHRLAPLSSDEGLELFLRRVEERRAKLRLDDDERAACQTIVEALDGLPLAIELAASRVGILTPKRMADRLHQRFRLLQKRTRDDDRQATLSTALDWSWQTLSMESQKCLAQLSVFRNGFDLASAAAVCAVDINTITEQIRDLVDQSMVQPLMHGKATRFQLLESIRLFAVDRHGEATGLEQLGAAHARYFSNLGMRLYFQSQTAALPDALARIRLERANLLAAFEQSVKDNPEHAAGAALGLVPLLFTQGPVSLGNDLFLRLAPEANQMAPTTAALFLIILARIHMSLGDQDQSLRAIERATTAANESRVDDLIAMVNESHVRLLSRTGEIDQAKALVRTGLAHVRQNCSAPHEARLHAAIGNLYYRTGQVDQALEAFAHSAKVFGDLDMSYSRAQSLGNAGLIHLAHRRFEAAEECFLICLREHESGRNLGEQALVHGYLGLLAMDRGDLEGAAQHYLQSVETGRQIAKQEQITVGQGYLGVIAQLRGRTDQALIRFEEAMESALSGTTSRVEGYFRCYHAGLLSRLGRDDEAEEHWQRSARLFGQVSDPHANAFMELTRAQAWCTDPARQGDLGALMDSILKPDKDARSLAERNEDLRFALRLLEMG